MFLSEEKKKTVGVSDYTRYKKNVRKNKYRREEKCKRGEVYEKEKKDVRYVRYRCTVVDRRRGVRMGKRRGGLRFKREKKGSGMGVVDDEKKEK